MILYDIRVLVWSDPLLVDLRVSLREKIFREVISNIIAHREYTSAAPATIKIYRDRVELENPNVAHFFGQITPDNVRPFPKNPTICKLMIQIGRFDELGSGVINVHRYLPLYANGAQKRKTSCICTSVPSGPRFPNRNRLYCSIPISIPISISISMTPTRIY